MLKEKIKISFVGMESTEALKTYTVDKMMKNENFYSDRRASCRERV